jgi:hypothetical protein
MIGEIAPAGDHFVAYQKAYRRDFPIERAFQAKKASMGLIGLRFNRQVSHLK